MSEAAVSTAEDVTNSAMSQQPPAAAHPPERKLSRDEEAREAFRRFVKGEDDAPSAAAKPGDEPPPAEAKTDGEEPTADDDAAKAKQAEPKKDDKIKTDADKLELNLARAQRDVKRLTTEAVAEKRARTDAETKLADVQKQLTELKAKAKANPLKTAEELSEMSLKDIMERASKGEFDIEDPYAKLPPEVREAIEFAKAEKAEKARLRAEDEERQSRAADVAVAKDFLTERSDDFEFLDVDSDEWIADAAREEFKRTGVAPDLDEVAKRCNAQVKGMLETLVGKPKLLKSFVSVPSIRDAVVNALGIDKPQTKATSSKAAPRASIASAPAEVVSRSDKKLNSDEEREEHLKNLRAFQTRESA